VRAGSDTRPDFHIWVDRSSRAKRIFAGRVEMAAQAAGALEIDEKLVHCRKRMDVSAGVAK